MSEPEKKPPQPVRKTKCPHCGNEEPAFFYVVNTSLSQDPLFSDVYCSICNSFVRCWNSV